MREIIALLVMAVAAGNALVGICLFGNDRDDEINWKKIRKRKPFRQAEKEKGGEHNV